MAEVEYLFLGRDFPARAQLEDNKKIDGGVDLGDKDENFVAMWPETGLSSSISHIPLHDHT